MKRIIIFFFTQMLATAGMSQNTALFDKLIFKTTRLNLPYRLLKPVNPKVKERFPLIIFLHGAGERGSDNERQLDHIASAVLDERARGKYPCYVLAPQCPAGDSWIGGKRTASGYQMDSEPSRPMKALIALIRKLEEEYPIDTTRIYITGLSMGGFGTFDLISRMPEKFAAAVPICGGADSDFTARFANIPMWIFHGSKDQIVPVEFSRTVVRNLWNQHASPGYTEYADIAHESWIQAYQEPHLLPWLFDQVRKTQN